MQTNLKTKVEGSVVIRLDVVLNYELEREILGFGDHVQARAPKILFNRIK